MHIADLITPERVVCCQESTSKKRTLEQLSQLLTRNVPRISTNEVFDSLIGRERLGSTGLGHGVAIPHGRIQRLQEPVGAFMSLNNGVDFDAIDRLPVDLLFALLVPQEATDAHLQLLAQLARMFSDSGFTQRLRATRDDQELYELLRHWEPERASA
jgi:PTS system nitrogen regulatory IIA component